MEQIHQILHSWDLGDVTATAIESFHHSAWDVNGTYILKRYAKADELSHSLRLSGLLALHGIPVAVFIPTRDGQLTSPDGRYGLMTKLPGSHRDFYQEPHLAVEMGRELARLHMAQGDIEGQIPHHDSDLLDLWQKRIKPSLKDAPAAMVAAVDASFCKAYPKLPRQLIHRDVHPQNVLFDNGRLTGWLDFDIGQRNVRVFDVAYLLSGLLVGNNSKPEQVEIWHRLFRDVVGGYDEINPLSGDEHAALPVLMVMIELLFVWFWGEQNNKEQQNNAYELAGWLYGKYKMEITGKHFEQAKGCF